MSRAAGLPATDRLQRMGSWLHNGMSSIADSIHAGLLAVAASGERVASSVAELACAVDAQKRRHRASPNGLGVEWAPAVGNARCFKGNPASRW
jgi:hypothetical protein